MKAKEEIVEFILERVSYHTKTELSNLNGFSKFEEVGVTSLYAVLICGELEDEYGLELEPILLFDCKTANDVAEFLLTIQHG